MYLHRQICGVHLDIHTDILNNEKYKMLREIIRAFSGVEDREKLVLKHSISIVL